MKEPRMNVSDRRSFANKKVDVKHTLKRLLSYLKPSMPLFITVFLGNLLSVVLSLLGPYICGLAVGEIKTDGTTNFKAITYYCVILAAVYIASELINYATTVGMAYVARNLSISQSAILTRVRRATSFPCFRTISTRWVPRLQTTCCWF